MLNVSFYMVELGVSEITLHGVVLTEASSQSGFDVYTLSQSEVFDDGRATGSCSSKTTTLAV